MSFFAEVDSLGIVENHIQEVLKLQHDDSLTILSSYSDARNRLVARLSTMPSGTFTAQHLRGVLAQVEAAITEINKSLNIEMLAGAQDASSMGVDHLINEMQTFDEKFTGAVTPINLNAALLANDTANFLVTKYQTNLDAYGNDLMTQITNGLFSATIGEVNSEEVVGRISKFFSAEEWKLRRIVRTELHNIYNMGKIRGMDEMSQDLIPDLMKTLMHPMDGRTGKDSIYAATLGLVANINEPFEYYWNGELSSFMSPPDRPNDRSVLVPYLPEWGDATGKAVAPGDYPPAS